MIKREPIAIVGLTALFPGSIDTAGFWNDILNARDLLTEVPSHYWLVDDYYDPDPAAPDKTYGRRGAFLSPVEFDTLEFGLPPAALPAIDSSQLLALIGAKRVLADAANGRAEHVPKDRISVFLGAAATTSAAMNMAARLQRPAWIKGMRESGIPESQVQEACDRIAACFTPLQENTFPGILSNVIAGRVANRFDLRGSNFTTDAACASSLAAISVAINDLYLGNSDMVLTGGVDTLNDIQMFTCFSKTPALSPTEDCRPFSSRSDGTMLGEGLAMFALRRMADAERDGDTIYASIRGLGSSSDGLAKSVYAPRPAGQAMALRRAYDAAGYGPETVELVEAHGTATAAGDLAEFEALREVFGAGGAVARQWCALGSVKSQIGHTKGAAGAAGLFKAAMALHHKTLPPTIKVDRPNPAMAMEESPFYLNTEARPWIRCNHGPRRASVSSFGFGGTNFHLALEEYSGSGGRPPRLTESPVELAVISAPHADGAARECRRLAAKLEAVNGEDAWRRAARESQRDFDPSGAVRLAVVASSRADFEKKLARVTAALKKCPEESIRDSEGVYYEPRHSGGPVAFLFSGQGSQYLGMGGGLAMVFDCAREVWDFAEGVFSEDGFSPRDAVFPRPVFNDSDRQRQQEFLTRTDIAQPALAAASLAQLALLHALGIKPAFAAGHSFGELVALHEAGCFSAGDLLRIARKRGELMAADGRTGTMTAVSYPIDDLRDFLNQPGPDGIVIANRNSPRQSVLSGNIASIEAVEERLAAAAISFRRLPVGGAFHSPLMVGAVEPFSRFLENIAFESPSLPVFSNTDAARYPRDPVLIRERIAQNLTSPVRFADEIEALHGAGARVFVEVGAGSVLRQLTAQCLRERPHAAIALSQRGEDDVSSLWQAVGQLSAAGVKVRFEEIWSAFHAVSSQPRSAPSSSTVLIDGAGYNRPYPPKGGSAALPRPNPEPAPAVAASTPVTALPVPERQPTQALAAPSSAAFELVQAQIGEAQKTSQAAILESLSITLKSLEAVARELSGGAAPEEIRPHTAPGLQTSQIAGGASVPPMAPSLEPVQSAPEPNPAALDPAALLMRIVAEKTGYPQDVLTLDVELEAGLGIDSIKRVEIFSAIQQQLPGLPEITPSAIGQLKSLRDILAFIGETSAPAAKPESAASTFNLERALLEIVSGKTGYPIDILNLDVELEAGLGIDSIKRVEIFSAIQQRVAAVPEFKAPEFKAEDAGRLRTLRDILAFVGAAPVAATLKRREVHLTQSRECGLPLSGLFSCGGIAIIDGGSALAGAVLDRLERLNISAQSYAGIPEGCRAAIYLGGLGPFASTQEALRVNHEAFEIARALARGSEPPALFVTVRDSAGVHGGWAAGIAGIAKTVACEWPRSAVKAMDLERGIRTPAETADVIVAELLWGGSDMEVTLRANGARLVPVLRPSEIGGGIERIGPDSVIVASGGGRGITAACLIDLARAARPRIALLGRTTLEDEPADCREAQDEAALKHVISRRPGHSGSLKEISRDAASILAAREIRSTLRALEQAGSPCAYFAADIRDAAGIGRAVASVRDRFGPVTAIVHGAGVIADKKIADKTPDQFALVFDTKAGGLRTLLAATQSDPIDTICLFSSVAARFGNPGQCDYAAANEVLNGIGAVEARRRGTQTLVRSIGWGPWDGGMVTAPLAAHFRSRGVGLIPIASGARAFVDELRHTTGGCEVLLAAGDDPSFSPATGKEPAQRAETSCEILVGRATYPFLDSHRIQQHAVVPVVLVNDWFHRIAESTRHGMRIARCRDLRVNRGIPLPAFDSDGHLLRVVSKAAGAGEIHCELRSPGGTLHYSAVLELRSELPECGAADEAGPESPGVQEMRSVSEIYSGTSDLFHGPDFRVIEELLKLDESGATGILHTTRNMRWPSGPWKTDAAALDGALQLIRLWGVRNLGGPSLPTRIGSFVQYGPETAATSLRCQIRARATGTLGLVADADLFFRDGRIFAEMRDIEMHLTPAS
jgi:acyl transferase domain-containing protein/NAD(P)-dependent dehydrogenase (short-subunit alcohol dehydrogenase family)